MNVQNNVRNEEELGVSFQKIIARLMANDDLVNLLYYTDKDPLSKKHLTPEQKDREVFEKLIKIVPKIGSKEEANSLVVVKIERGDIVRENTDFENIKFNVEIFVPLTQWLIKDSNLRPFAIMSQVKKSLQGKKINGLGKIQGGSFALNFLTEEMSAYELTFFITQYE